MNSRIQAPDPLEILLDENELKEVDLFVAHIENELKKLKNKKTSHAVQEKEAFWVTTPSAPNEAVAYGVCNRFHNAGWTDARFARMDDRLNNMFILKTDFVRS